MKELVRHSGQELPIRALRHEVVFPDSDPCGIQVFDTVGSLRLNFEQEGVFLVGKLAEHCQRGFNDVLNVGSHLCSAQRNIRFTEYETMMGSSGFEFENLEVADEGRGIDEDVVIGCRVSIALFFESRIYLPTAWCVEF